MHVSERKSCCPASVVFIVAIRFDDNNIKKNLRNTHTFTFVVSNTRVPLSLHVQCLSWLVQPSYDLDENVHFVLEGYVPF